MALIEALAPATAEDTLMYHFRIPYDYVINSSLIYSPFHPYNMPHLMQILVTFPFMIGAGDIGAHLIFFSFCIFLICVIYRFVTEYFDNEKALLAIILFISTPMFSYTKVSGMVEVGLSTVILLCLWSLVKSLNDSVNPKEWLFVTGIFAGIACGIKYYGLFLLIIVPLIIVSSYKKLKLNFNLLFLYIFTFIAGAIAFGFPFYLKNFLMTGNPLYPAFFDLFGGKDWSKEMQFISSMHFDKFKNFGGDSFIDLIISPWLITMEGEKFLSGKNGYGFIFITLLPLFFLHILSKIRDEGFYEILPNNKVINIIVWFAIFYWVLWFYFALQRGRHLMPVFVLLSIISADIVIPYL